MPFDELSDLLQQKSILNKKIRNSSYICWICEKVFNHEFPNQKIKIASYKNQTIKVIVPSLIISQKVSMHQKEIIEKIFQESKDLKVKILKIKTQLGNCNS